MESRNSFRSRDDIKRAFDVLNYDFDHFRLAHFVDHIKYLRNRNILVIGYPFVPEVTGLWTPGKAVDFIFYKSTTHPTHQTHIILHELAHMLLDHPLQPVDQIISPEVLKEFDAGLQGYLRTIYRYEDIYEEEAEAFVQLVQQQVMRAQRLIELTTGDTSISQFKPFIRGVPFQDDYWSRKR